MPQMSASHCAGFIEMGERTFHLFSSKPEEFLSALAAYPGAIAVDGIPDNPLRHPGAQCS